MDVSAQYLLPSGYLESLIVLALAWLVVVIACLVAVRRPWAWPGLAGGVLGLAVAGLGVADALKLRSDVSEPSAQIVEDEDDLDYPGILADLDLDTELLWAQSIALVLVAVAFVTGAVLARRSRAVTG